MASKYLGSFGKWDFYIATAFGEYRDEEAVRDIQRARYKMITDGRVKKNGERESIDIFCTAITLDHDTQREVSLFDDLETTYHVFALGNGRKNRHNGDKLGAACSYALESIEKEGGVVMGLPHENRVNNGYPEGFNLDEFRETYEYGGKKTTPEERVELFRYFKSPEHRKDNAAGFGVFRGGFHEFINERARKGKPPATKWLFCSSPRYYQGIYRPFGSMLTPLLIDGINHNNTSPSLKEIKVLDDDHTKDSGGCFYEDNKASYRHPIIISRNPGEEKKERWFDYLSQIVDCDRASNIIKEDESFKNHRQQSQVAWRIIGEDFFNEHHNNIIDKGKNYAAKRAIGATPSRGWK